MDVDSGCFANICTERELTNFDEVCVFVWDWNKNESMMKCETNEMDKLPQTHTGTGKNESMRCVSVWKIVCGCRFDVVEVCTRVYGCAYEGNQFNTNQMPHCRTRVCMPKKHTNTVDVRLTSCLAYTYPHRTLYKQSNRRMNREWTHEHTCRAVNVSSRNEMNRFLCWHPCRLRMKRRTIWKSDWIMLVSMWFIWKLIPR